MEVDLGQLRMPCTCGRAHNITVKGVWIEEGAARRLYEMLTEGDLREFTAPVIVWDENTSEAVEERMEDVAEICQEICLSGKDLRADDRSVEILEETLPDETDLILAVGGGTIHDLSRYVAYERRIPLISVPTAATMDGFTSTDSVLFWKGEKKRFQAEKAGPVFFLFRKKERSKEKPRLMNLFLFYHTHGFSLAKTFYSRFPLYRKEKEAEKNPAS